MRIDYSNLIDTEKYIELISSEELKIVAKIKFSEYPSIWYYLYDFIGNTLDSSVSLELIIDAFNKLEHLTRYDIETWNRLKEQLRMVSQTYNASTEPYQFEEYTNALNELTEFEKYHGIPNTFLR